MTETQKEKNSTIDDIHKTVDMKWEIIDRAPDINPKKNFLKNSSPSFLLGKPSN